MECRNSGRITGTESNSTRWAQNQEYRSTRTCGKKPLYVDFLLLRGALSSSAISPLLGVPLGDGDKIGIIPWHRPESSLLEPRLMECYPLGLPLSELPVGIPLVGILTGTKSQNPISPRWSLAKTGPWDR